MVNENENEFEFVSLTPMTHNSLPEEMKDFISSSGIMGMMPKRNFISTGHRIVGQVIDLETIEDSINEENDTEDNSRIVGKILSGERNIESCDLDEDTDQVLEKIEMNNMGIFKFLQANGMPYDKAKKFLRRVVRLSIKYVK